MRVLIYTRSFLPRIGGLELTVAQISDQLVQLGHEVTVITTTPRAGKSDFPYTVVRNPRAKVFLQWMRWCDVFHHANVSLRGLWPLILVHRPWVVANHSWYSRPDGAIAWQDRLKRFALRYAAASISVSKAIADDLGVPSIVINNCYRDDIFRIIPGERRTRDLVFVGRLVSDKGADILLKALQLLRQGTKSLDLTIVGDGPDRASLEGQTRDLGLTHHVRFVGTRVAEDLARILNQHKILVVPSRYNEPFGVVALEGIACGCVVVGSAGGGLKEAIGACGRVFPNANAVALAALIGNLLSDTVMMDECLRSAQGHLASHTRDCVTRRYIEVFEAAAWRAR